MKRISGITVTGLIAITLLLVTLVGVHAAGDSPQVAPFSDQRDAAQAAIVWLLEENQNADGGFGVDLGTGDPASSIPATLDAMLAMSAVGYSAEETYAGASQSALDYLRANNDDLTAFVAIGGGPNGKVILALTAANKDPRTFEVHNYVEQLKSSFDPLSGLYATQTAFDQALAILALSAVGEMVPEVALTGLESQQAIDGSWDDGFGTPQNSDATAMAVMALIAGGRQPGDSSVAAALTFLSDSQLESGGWEYGAGFGENVNSTALVLQALSAIGEDFYSGGGEWAKGGASPLDVLLSWQVVSGAFQADFGQGRVDNFFATVQAIPALTGKAFPLPSRSEAARAGVICLAGLQDVKTGGWEQFAGFGVNAGGTARAIEAIAEAGHDPQAARWMPGSTGAVGALEQGMSAYLATGKGGVAGILAQGAAAAGAPYDPSNFGGVNLPQTIMGFLNEQGEYDDTSFGVSAHGEAMLGLLTSGEMPAQAAVDFLLANQEAGNWGDADGNGLALNALGRMGVALPAGITHLRATQLADGGWGFEGSPANPSSTSEVIQGLVAQEQNPFALAWSKIVSGRIMNGADVVLEQQQANGCWPNFDATLDDPFGTTDAVILLSQMVVHEPIYTGMMPIIQAPRNVAKGN